MSYARPKIVSGRTTSNKTAPRVQFFKTNIKYASSSSSSSSNKVLTPLVYYRTGAFAVQGKSVHSAKKIKIAIYSAFKNIQYMINEG